MSRWVPLAAVVALLAAVMIAATFGNPSIEALPEGLVQTVVPVDESTADADATATDEQAPADPGAPGEAPAWLSWLVLAVAAIGILIVVGLLIGRLVTDRRKAFVERTTPIARLDSRESVRAAVAAGLAELDLADTDARRTVIACWVRLEAAAREAGTGRAAGDTSTDLVTRLLGAHDVSEPVLAAFAATYRSARFSPDAVDESMREQARLALGQLRDELTASVR